MADASSLVVMTNLYIGQMFGSTDLVHMPAAVITGLGFLGAGTILVTKNHEIKGLTTAAGLWAVSIIGIAIGSGFYTGGTVCYAFILMAMNVLRLVDMHIKQEQHIISVYFELRSRQVIGQMIRQAKADGVSLTDLTVYDESEYGIGGAVGAWWCRRLRRRGSSPRKRCRIPPPKPPKRLVNGASDYAERKDRE